MRGVIRGIALGAVVMTVGCAGSSNSFSLFGQRGRQVSANHVCDHTCYNHVYNGSKVVVLRNHRHGPSCGHVWSGRHWSAVGKPSHAVNVSYTSSYRNSHQCDRQCDQHFWNGSRLIKLNNHKHGYGCGHQFKNNRWEISFRATKHGSRFSLSGHTCNENCHNHYWNGAKLVSLKRHRHRANCGHQWDGSHWVVSRMINDHYPQKFHKGSYKSKQENKYRTNRYKSNRSSYNSNRKSYKNERNAYKSDRDSYKSKQPRRARTTSFRSSSHRHSPSCGCVFNSRNGKWIELGKRHKHHRGCGHKFLNGRWTIRG